VSIYLHILAEFRFGFHVLNLSRKHLSCPPLQPGEWFRFGGFYDLFDVDTADGGAGMKSKWLSHHLSLAANASKLLAIIDTIVRTGPRLAISSAHLEH
jgi:hypothetical protein